LQLVFEAEQDFGGCGPLWGLPRFSKEGATSLNQGEGHPYLRLATLSRR